MKQQSYLKAAKLIGSLLTGLLTIASPAQNFPARQTEPASLPPPPVSSNPALVASDRRLQNLQFDEIPLSEVVEKLRKDFPEVNFVTSGPDDVPITLELHDVTLGNIIKALEIAGNRRLAVQIIGPELVSIMSFPLRRPENNTAMKVFNLTPYLQGKEGQAAEEAIRNLDEVLQICWTMRREAQQLSPDEVPLPKMQLHAPTKLLILTGDPANLAAAEDVIINLMAYPKTVPSIPSKPANPALAPGAGLPTK